MNTGTSFANKVVIVLLMLILAALGVVIYQNSQKQAAQAPARNVEVAAESAVAPPEVPGEQPLEVVPPAPVAKPRATTANRTPTIVRRTTPAPTIPAPAAQEFDTPAQELGLQPVPVGVPVAPVPEGDGVVAAPQGEISGRILLAGAPPAEIPIQMDATCGRLQAGPVTTRHYVVSKDGGLANVFVYIKKGLENLRFAAPKDTPVMDNVGCMFEPYMMGVQAGQKFLVRNSDPVLHNFHLTAKNNRERNIALPLKGQSVGVNLDKPEVLVRVKCDVHPWMFAYVGVTTHPFFAVTDANGQFQFPAELPSGTYTVAAVHLKAGEITREITVRTGEKQALEFQFTVPAQANPKVALGNP